MDTLPSRGHDQGVRFTVADFIEAGRARLRLDVLAGGAKGLARVVGEPIVNRVGLALTGFYEHFAWKRLQLIGRSEMAYLKSLTRAERLERLAALVAHRASCLIFTNGERPEAAWTARAEALGAVVLASPLKTRQFARLAAFVLEELAAPKTTIYGTTVEVGGLGVMIEGDPGLGKSETALGLVKRGHALVADDLTCIRKDLGSGALFASASEATAGFMEIRGLGILHIPSIFGVTALRREKRLELVITFRRLKDVVGEIDRVEQTLRPRRILDVDVPNVLIPVSAGRDLVNLVETAVQQQRLLQTGYDPVEALSRRLTERAERNLDMPGARPAKGRR